LNFYRSGLESGSFDKGIEMALRRILADPQFVFRFERAPADVPSGTAHRITDLELASRLSFFLWSSIPDDELLSAAEQGKLQDPSVLEREVRRMIADPRSIALTRNFVGQWLLVRNIATVRPGDPFSLTFDETLRQSLHKETELFFDAIIRENHPVPELITADFTFLDERLANHYGISGVQGSRFRRIALPADS